MHSKKYDNILKITFKGECILHERSIIWNDRQVNLSGSKQETSMIWYNEDAAAPKKNYMYGL